MIKKIIRKKIISHLGRVDTDKWSPDKIRELLDVLNKPVYGIGCGTDYRDLIFWAAKVCETRIKNVVGKSNKTEDCMARYLVWENLKEKGLSYADVALVFTNHDRSAIFHGLRTHKNHISVNDKDTMISKERFTKAITWN